MVPIFASVAETVESPDYNTPELGQKYYGQADHVRKYGTDFALRLEKPGLQVKQVRTCDCFSERE